MKVYVTIIVLFFSSSVMAKTEAYFPITGAQAMVNMKTKAFMEEDDPSPEKLFQGMNVPPKNSIGGLGKKIESLNKNLTIVCADQGNKQFFCNITVKRSSDCLINKSEQQIKCSFRGAKALELYEKFYSNNDEYFYQNSDGELSILSFEDQFVLKYTNWQ